ncbi:MAG: hypothetical protein AAF146_05925 [Bacteroidota bacterium]
MQRSKLIQQLRPLKPRELQRFRDFVFSPFFNKNQKVRTVCSAILSFAPDFESPQLNRPALFQLLYPDSEYSDGRINNVLSDLFQLLHQFFTQLQLERTPSLQVHFLLDQLLLRESHTEIPRVAKRYRATQQRTPHRNYAFFYDEYRYYDQMDRYFLTKGKREYDPNLQEKSDHLDRYYLGNKLRIACDMLSRNTVAKASYQCHFLDDLLAQLPEALATEAPALRVYYQVLQMLREPEVEHHYQTLVELLHAHLDRFPQEELRVLFTYAINYCIRQINSGKRGYYRKIFTLYRQTLDGEIIFKNGHLTSWTFKNIITTGIRLREFDWVEGFIFQYQANLIPEEQAGAVAFNLAALYYARQDYLAALRQLHRVDFTNTSYHLGAKIIQIKSYFELDETEALYALMEATRKYVLRSAQLSEYGKQANNNYLKLTRQLYRLKGRRTRLSEAAFAAVKKRLGERLESDQLVANKDWLRAVFRKLTEEPSPPDL